MIAVYRGNEKSISLKSLRGSIVPFDRDVPSHLDEHIARKIGKMKDFHRYAKETEYKPYQSDPILVRMPRRVDHFIAALSTLKVISENFPLSPVHCMCQSWFRELLPKECHWVPAPSSSRYYRDYDLNPSAYPHKFTRVTNAIIPLPDLFIQAAGLWEIEMESGPPSVAMSGESLGRIMVLANSDIPCPSQFLEYSHVDAVIDPSDDISEFLPDLLTASAVIVVGDIPAAYLACAMGKPVLSVLPAGFDFDKVQYEIFDNWSFIESAGLSDNRLTIEMIGFAEKHGNVSFDKSPNPSPDSSPPVDAVATGFSDDFKIKKMRKSGGKKT